MKHGENFSNESTQKTSKWKTLFGLFCVFGVLSLLFSVGVTLTIMFFSYGENMWDVLYNLKLGIM